MKKILNMWLEISNLEQMQRLGQLLSQHLPKQCLVFLQADLGMGKTTLCQSIVKYSGYSGTVKSPTYTLVEEYQAEQRQVFHFDLYRLSDPEELEYIGIWDYLNQDALSLIEWPNKGAGILPKPNLIIEIDDFKNGRKVCFESSDDKMMAQLYQQITDAGFSEVKE